MATNRKMPKHVAFIMDGNGRFGEARGRRRSFGHKAGAEKVREVIKYLRQQEIPYVSLYAFSTENWSRPNWEIDTLMKLLRRFSKSEVESFVENDIRVRFIGRRDRLTESLRAAMDQLEEATAGGSTMLLQIAVDYGGRDELVRAMNQAIAIGQPLTEGELSELLDTRLAPDPDLIIRTGGQQRLSNFMLWQAAYAEWQFTDTLWPELTIEEIEIMIDLFCGIDRRFGQVAAE